MPDAPSGLQSFTAAVPKPTAVTVPHELHVMPETPTAVLHTTNTVGGRITGRIDVPAVHGGMPGRTGVVVVMVVTTAVVVVGASEVLGDRVVVVAARAGMVVVLVEALSNDEPAVRRVEHSPDVVHAVGDRRQVPHAVGKPLAALVEDDEARERGESIEDVGPEGPLPRVLQVGDESRREE